jgi:hypothetical protein
MVNLQFKKGFQFQNAAGRNCTGYFLAGGLRRACLAAWSFLICSWFQWLHVIAVNAVTAAAAKFNLSVESAALRAPRCFVVTTTWQPAPWPIAGAEPIGTDRQRTGSAARRDL